MAMEDPRRRIAQPFQAALDALVLRWVGVYLLAASVVVCPALCEAGIPARHVIHACLPLFLLGFIGVHLLWRHPAPRGDGWRRAFEAAPRSARMTILVGGLAMAGVAGAFLTIFCPLGEPMALGEALGIWLPIFAPLYVGAVWVSVDCSIRRLGCSADAAEQQFRQYWHDVAEHSSH